MVLFAINAASGNEYWRFDPNDPSVDVHGPRHKHIIMNIRGMTYWSDGRQDHRIFYTAGSRTYAINAKTGQLIPSFGTGGFIDLHHGLGRNVDDLLVVSTSPGVVYEDVLIMGHRVDESLPSAPGHIRAFDVRTGELRWIFHTIPQPGEEGYETWDDPNAYQFIGGANVWSGFSLDEERGLVFCGTGSASYDFWGGNRTGDNLFANCILALDATTGQRRWHYQTLQHDLWDKDLPTPPALVTVQHNGQQIDAVAQPTKNGYLFLLDRETGVPLFPVEEVPVPTEGALPGEKPHHTQPIPSVPAPFARQSLAVTDVNPYLDEEDKKEMQAILTSSRLGNPYLLPGEDTHLMLPGFDGGGEWG
ncbi:MAG: PQQ-binding-like beta-propeller repeat protein, partial [Bacteroidota bacterium]